MKRKMHLPPSSDILATVSMTLIKSFSLSLNSRSTSSRPRATICLESNRSVTLVDCLPIPTDAGCTQHNTQHLQSCQAHYTHTWTWNWQEGSNPAKLSIKRMKKGTIQVYVWDNRAVLHVCRVIVFKLFLKHIKCIGMLLFIMKNSPT